MLCTLRHKAILCTAMDGFKRIGVCRPVHDMQEKRYLAVTALTCFHIQHSRLYCRSMLLLCHKLLRLFSARDRQGHLTASH